jgi:adenylate cyclase
LKNLHPKIRSRIQILKNRKNPTPPNLDKAFVELYKEYNDLINKRDSAIESYLEKIPIPQDRYIAIESLRSLRDSAWEDSILLRYKPNTSILKQYALDSAFREEYLNRWKELRKWVTDAKSELPPPNLKKMISDGIIGKSRSEAEELLWELDSTPLIPLNDKSLAFTILKRNITGIIRTYVDRTDGMNKIRENRNKAILTAIVIGMLSIFLAIFISGVVVQKIKRIIHRAEDVGKGNLGVVFEYGGNDEFGNLTIALNHMVQGLNEREKIKGILGSMIDPIVVSEAMKDLQALKRGSEKTITAFFSDIASFSSISEKLTSPELADLLNEYLSAMTIILKKYDGVLDKYIGDAIVGIFNSPIDVDDHAYKAV